MQEGSLRTRAREGAQQKATGPLSQNGRLWNPAFPYGCGVLTKLRQMRKCAEATHRKPHE